MTELGAVYRGAERCCFRVWAPRAETVDVKLIAPDERVIPMTRDEWGYFEAEVDGAAPGALYKYRLNGDTERPDPASRCQPQGVHGPSQVVDPAFDWREEWPGLPLQDYILYELHVGTFTPDGTFDAIIPRLPYLRELGVTAIEIMPVAQFPGARNWGYDGVYPFAVQASYGGGEGLKRLVQACHQHGLAVVLDVVYNHLGPDGAYLSEYGPYFTDAYQTPWGSAVNFDGPHSDHVRAFFIENALYFLSEFHIDALRLDAVHAMLDFSTTPFLEELAQTVEARGAELGRQTYLIAESDLNNPRLVRPPEQGGYGLDAQWVDDFHHILHTVLTGEAAGYYEDFGRFEQLAQAWRQGYVYAGQYSPFRRRRHGAATTGVPAWRFVVYSQNHDQVGNRCEGDRLSRLVPFPALKLAAATVLLSPFIPLLFMGEEYGETAPFQYFVSHEDPALAEAVRTGRAAEFGAFTAGGEVPDPQAEATFERSRVNPDLRHEGRHRALWNFYRELIRLRRAQPALANLSQHDQAVVTREAERVLFVHRWAAGDEVCLVLSFSDAEQTVTLPFPSGRWRKRLDAADEAWGGPGSPTESVIESKSEAQVALAPWACVVYSR